MKIDSSVLGMESARKYVSTDTTVRKYMIMEYQGDLSYSDALNAAVAENDGETQKEDTTDKAKDILNDWESNFKVTRSRLNMRCSEDNTFDKIKQLTLQYILEMLFPSKYRKSNDIIDKYQDAEGAYTNVDNQSANQTAQTNSITQAFGIQTNVLKYSSFTSHYECEQTSFSTIGKVVTSDGRQIDFNINVAMSREFVEEYTEELEVAKISFTDPLVINLDTDVTTLSDQKFYFDIDADGQKEEISCLGSGSGYLALDKNEDGVIQDGSELFGAKTGNGFADLAQYDDDKNGWIDENDEIWSKLKIWTTNEDGENVLYSLKDKGVGAIALENVNTKHSIQNSAGDVLGVVRRSGVFLYENGNVGTIQHVDMASYAKEA